MEKSRTILYTKTLVVLVKSVKNLYTKEVIDVE